MDPEQSDFGSIDGGDSLLGIRESGSIIAALGFELLTQKDVQPFIVPTEDGEVLGAGFSEELEQQVVVFAGGEAKFDGRLSGRG